MKASAWVGILAVTGALGGCGGDDKADRPDPREDEAAVRQLLAEALDALYDGDGPRACSLYTSAFRREMVATNQAANNDVSPKGRTCEEQVKNYAPILKRFVPDRNVKVTRVTVKGDVATAYSDFHTTRGLGRIREVLVRRNGKWKINHDDEIKVDR